ncbi:MAG: hypothetical protein ACREUZ_07165, partial [Burkholderiales bacterium]
MTYALNSNEVYTDVGPVVKGIFRDEGWTVSDLPSAIMPIGPSGSIDVTNPNFTFTGVTDATGYQVTLTTAGGELVFDTHAGANTICSGSSCTLPSPVALTEGTDYQWRARGQNDFGDGPWSSSMPFD